MKAFPCPSLLLIQSIKQNAQAKLGPCQSQALLSITRGYSGRKKVLQLSKRKLDPFLFPPPTSPCFGAICKTEMLIIPHGSQLLYELTLQGSAVLGYW